MSQEHSGMEAKAGPPDRERKARLAAALRDAGLDAIVCRLPSNVLLLSGYYPVVGTAVAVVTCDGIVGVLAPDDERDLAERAGADALRLFEPASLQEIVSYEDAAAEPLRLLLSDLGLSARERIGVAVGPASEPASYAAMLLPVGSLPALLQRALPGVVTAPADALLRRQRSTLTKREIDRLTDACGIAGAAYERGAGALVAGASEAEAAAAFAAPLSSAGIGWRGCVQRADGHTAVMSGPNAARAFGAYARSTVRKLQTGDLALVHANSYADGYWTDVTRTFVVGRDPDHRQQELFAAVLEARAAALQSIRAGVAARDVDRAARDVLRSHGLGEAFKHPTGHGVGFAAIDHDALPRLHPASPDVLEAGMVFNVEPAVYIEGYGGIRHCDMVLVTEQGAQVLTPFGVGKEVAGSVR